MKLAVTALLLSAVMAAPVAAQVRYGAVLDGAQETPAPILASGSGGWGRATLNPDKTLTYEVRTFGLSATMAHIHKGAVGVGGGIIFTLAGGPTSWSGTTVALSAAQEADLRAGLYYFNVHTAANPNGQIRGQILRSPKEFGARIDASQETPPNASTATGNALITLNPDNSLTYTVTSSGLVGATSAHFHGGAFGVMGGIEVILSGGPTVWSGTSTPISSGQLDVLQTLGWYVNLHTGAFPGGEIRGQIVPSGTELFNSAAAEWAPMATLTTTGAPTDVAGGGTFNVQITGGTPGATPLLLVSLLPGAALVNGVPFLLDPASLIITGLPLPPLDGTGAFTLPVLTPAVPVTLDIALQAVVLTPTAANGKYNSSSAVAVTLQHF